MRHPSPRLFLLTLGVSLAASAAFGVKTKTPRPTTPEEAVRTAVIERLEAVHNERARFSRAVLLPPTYALHVAKAPVVGAEGERFLTFTVEQGPPNMRSRSKVAGPKSAHKRKKAKRAIQPPEVETIMTGCVYLQGNQASPVDVYVADVGTPATFHVAAEHPALKRGLFGGLLSGDEEDERGDTPPSAPKRTNACQSAGSV